MRGGFVALVALLTVAGCGSSGPARIASSSSAAARTATAESPARTSGVSIPAPPVVTSAPAGCKEAPSVVVDIINAAFTNGEHLESIQAVDGSHAATYVGGNIVGAAGERVSSQDTWVLVDGQVYALTSDARRHTTLKDGRDVAAIYSDWPQYNDAAGTCVGIVTRAQNR